MQENELNQKLYIVCIDRISLWPLQIVLLGDNLLDINYFQYSFVVMQYK